MQLGALGRERRSNRVAQRERMLNQRLLVAVLASIVEYRWSSIEMYTNNGAQGISKDIIVCTFLFNPSNHSSDECQTGGKTDKAESITMEI